MKKGLSVELSVTILAGLACVFLHPSINLPVWILFIAWSWYFTLGSTPLAFKEAIPSLGLGMAVCILAILLIDIFGKSMGPVLSIAVAVFITVLIMMYSLKLNLFKSSTVAFNAYSCMFAGYYQKCFPSNGNYVHDLVFAVIWIGGACILGLIVGFLSIEMTKIGVKEEA